MLIVREHQKYWLYRHDSTCWSSYVEAKPMTQGGSYFILHPESRTVASSPPVLRKAQPSSFVLAGKSVHSKGRIIIWKFQWYTRRVQIWTGLSFAHAEITSWNRIILLVVRERMPITVITQLGSRWVNKWFLRLLRSELC